MLETKVLTRKTGVVRLFARDLIRVKSLEASQVKLKKMEQMLKDDHSGSKNIAQFCVTGYTADRMRELVDRAPQLLKKASHCLFLLICFGGWRARDAGQDNHLAEIDGLVPQLLKMVLDRELRIRFFGHEALRSTTVVLPQADVETRR